MKQRLKRALLPGAGPRTIPFGLCRGLRFEIDFEHETLFYLGLYEVEIARHVPSSPIPARLSACAGTSSSTRTSRSR